MTIIERLIESRVILNNNCWYWRGAKDDKGYGKLVINKMYYRVPRLSAMIWLNGFNINDPESHILHTCDNPSCFNPEHLYVGNHTYNMQDIVKHNRHPKMNQTHCINGHEFTPENTYRAPSIKTRRSCVACRKENRKFVTLAKKERLAKFYKGN